MAKIHFDLDSRGVEELLSSPEMRSLVDGYAQQVAGRAASLSGLEYEVESKGKHRAVGAVKTGSAHAYYDALANKTLNKALGV